MQSAVMSNVVTLSVVAPIQNTSFSSWLTHVPNKLEYLSLTRLFNRVECNTSLLGSFIVMKKMKYDKKVVWNISSLILKNIHKTHKHVNYLQQILKQKLFIDNFFKCQTYVLGMRTWWFIKRRG
jgi:hypothetical protein